MADEVQKFNKAFNDAMASDWKSHFGQPVAGFLEMFANSPEAIKRAEQTPGMWDDVAAYITPNFLRAFAGLTDLGIGYGAGALGFDETRQNYYEDAGGHLGDVMSGSENIDRLIGTEQPKDTAAQVLRALSGAIPIFTGPQYSKLANALIDIVSPGLTSRSGTALAASTAVPAVAADYIDNQFDDEYVSQLFAKPDVPPHLQVAGSVFAGAMQGMSNLAQQNAPQVIDAKASEVYSAPGGYQYTIEDVEQPATAGATGGFKYTVQDVPTTLEYSASEAAEQSFDELAKTFGGIMVLGALLGGSRALYGYFRAHSRADAQKAAAKLTGEKEVANVPSQVTEEQINTLRGPVTTRKVAAVSEIVDANAPLIDSAQKAVDAGRFSEDLMKQLLEEVHMSNGARLSSRLRYSFVTGALPDSGIRTHRPLADIYADTAKLSPEQLQLLNDALVAGTVKDDLPTAANGIWRGKDGSRWGASDLDQIGFQARNDPKVNTLVSDYRRFFKDILRHVEAEGLISHTDFVDMTTRRPNYAPLAADLVSDQSLLRRIFRSEPEVVKQVAEAFRERAKLNEGVKAGEVKKPVEMAHIYAQMAVQAAQNNRMRRLAVQALDKYQRAYNPRRRRPDGKMLRAIEKVGKNYTADQNIGEKTFDVFTNGEAQRWVVRDPGWMSALSSNPRAFVKGLTTARFFFQNVVTGKWRPGFLPTALVYEMVTAMFTANKGQGIGYLDKLVKAITNGKYTMTQFGVPDPTLLFAPLIAGGRGLSAMMRLSMSNVLRDSISQNGIIARTLGPQGAQRVRDMALRSFEKSLFARAWKYGMTAAPLMEPSPRAVQDAIAEISPSYTRKYGTGLGAQMRTMAVVRGLTGVMEVMHSSVRMQSFAANTTKGMTEAQLRYQAFQANTLTGDVLRHGSSRIKDPVLGKMTFQQFISTVPYANHFIQVTARWVQAFRDHPIRFMGMVVAFPMLGREYLISQLGESEQAREHYANLTVEQRSRMFPLYDADGNLLREIPIDPMLRPIWSAFIEPFLVTHGIRREGKYDPDVAELIWGSLWRDVVPDPFGPGPRAASAALGMELPEIGRNRFDTSPINEYTRAIPGDLRDDAYFGNYTLTRRLEAVAQELAGSAGSLVTNVLHAMHVSVGADKEFADVMDDAANAFLGSTYEVGKPGVTGLHHLWGAEKIVSLDDTTYKELRPRLGALRDVKEAYDQIIRGEGRTSITGTQSPFNPNIDGPAGSLLSAVGPEASMLSKFLGLYNDQTSQIKDILERLDLDPNYQDPRKRIEQRNELIKTLKDLNDWALDTVSAAEERISDRLGRPFTFMDPSLNSYLEQLKAPQD